MRYLALAVDYDGTLTLTGRLDPRVASALERLRATGRKTLLVTGRQLEDLLATSAPLGVFDCVVAENGAVLYWPATREVTALCPPPPQAFCEALLARGVPLSVGRVIVATHHPHEVEVIQTLHALGLELQLIFNGDAVMILPPGINKASGLEAALRKLGLSTHEVVGMGNGSNDHSFLAICECAVAVANAIPQLKDAAAFVTRGAAGEGVIEVIDELVRSDLAERGHHLTRSSVLLGRRLDGTEVGISAYGHSMLVAGPSGSGKSTFASGLIERLAEKAYQLCIIDPEGDYGTLDGLMTLGSRARAPSVSEVLEVLADPKLNLVVNLLGVPLADRPGYFLELLPLLQSMRARTGRPHWLLIDEVHHLLPASWGMASRLLPQTLGEAILLTVHPDQVARPILGLVDLLVAVGPRPEATVARFCAAIGEPMPAVPTPAGPSGEVVTWLRGAGTEPFRMQVVRARSERLRHLRKYAEGDLGPGSFVFRGPEAKLKLRAPNLIVFCQLAEGVDEATWLHHLRRGDYSRWFREAIKDEGLAREAERTERHEALSAAETLRLICGAVQERYTL